MAKTPKSPRKTPPKRTSKASTESPKLSKAEQQALDDQAHATARAADLRPFPEDSSTNLGEMIENLEASRRGLAAPTPDIPAVAAPPPPPATDPSVTTSATTTEAAGNAAAPDEGAGGADASSDPPQSNTPNTDPNTPDGPGNPGHIENAEGDPDMPDLIFIDARKAQNAAEQHLANAKSGLEHRKEKSIITPDEERQLEMLTLLLENARPDYALEDLYLTLRQELHKFAGRGGVPDLMDGAFGAAQRIGDVSRAEMMTAMVWGTLSRDGIGAPRLLDQMHAELSPDGNLNWKISAISQRFSEAMTKAVAQFNTHDDLFREVLKVMAFDPDVNGTGQLRAADWVSVTDTLIKKELRPDAPGLATHIRAAINDRLAPQKDSHSATQEIILPNLEAETAQEVQRVNLEAAQAIYFAAMMDEARLFDSVDKLAELFQIGALPLERGQAGEYLYRYIRQTPDRISPFERRNTYARVFGAATGDPNGAGGTIFRNFDELWMRFVSSVSDWYRKNQVESLFASAGKFVPSQEQVRKTGLDLAANLSLYCYGGTWFVASELQKNIADYIDLLSSPEIKQLYGARDMWQVIDQISVLEFGQPVNTIRARTKANAGAAVLGWLEKHASALSEPGSVLINPSDIVNPNKSSTRNAINDPTDYDLVTACEQWLAIEGVGTDIVELNAAASPSAVTSTAPVRVPPAAQDILGAFGFEHGGTGHDHPNAAPNGAARLMN